MSDEKKGKFMIKRLWMVLSALWILAVFCSGVAGPGTDLELEIWKWKLALIPPAAVFLMARLVRFIVLGTPRNQRETP